MTHTFYDLKDLVTRLFTYMTNLKLKKIKKTKVVQTLNLKLWDTFDHISIWGLDMNEMYVRR
jgi:hypothetical protein